MNGGRPHGGFTRGQALSGIHPEPELCPSLLYNNREAEAVAAFLTGSLEAKWGREDGLGRYDRSAFASRPVLAPGGLELTLGLGERGLELCQGVFEAFP
jgi:hypothetical protein